MVAYLPPDSIWALPGIIASKAITHVQVDCDELYRGVATGVSIYLSTLAEMHSLEARFVEGRRRAACRGKGPYWQRNQQAHIMHLFLRRKGGILGSAERHVGNECVSTVR